jgi:hypothetical protein
MARTPAQYVEWLKNNSGWFRGMFDANWTVKRIAGAFNVPRCIAQHIQHTAQCERDAYAIANASRMLREQVGF